VYATQSTGVSWCTSQATSEHLPDGAFRRQKIEQYLLQIGWLKEITEAVSARNEMQVKNVVSRRTFKRYK
jgi:hypothetical protein